MRKYSGPKVPPVDMGTSAEGADSKESSHLLDERLLEQWNERVRPWNVNVNLKNRSHGPHMNASV